MNKSIVMGRLGRDPEIKSFDSGGKIASFSLAVTEKYKNRSGEMVEATEWINCQVGGKRAEVVEKYVTKGMLLLVEGKIKTRTWEKDGKKNYATYVDVFNFEFTGKAGAQQSPSGGTSAPVKQEAKGATPAAGVGDPDDLPF